MEKNLKISEQRKKWWTSERREAQSETQKNRWTPELRKAQSERMKKSREPGNPYYKKTFHKSKNRCGEISGTFWGSMKTGAKIRKLDFDVTIEYIWDLFLSQERKCALSGLELQFPKFRELQSMTTASLDRIDSSKGYVEGNLQWVHKDLNHMKLAYKNEYFIEMCKLVAQYNP